MKVILVTDDSAKRKKTMVKQIRNNHLNLTNSEATYLSATQEGCLTATKPFLALEETNEYSIT